MDKGKRVAVQEPDEGMGQEMNIRSINAKLAPHHVTLTRGKGYLYYTYDDGDRFETRSVYTQRLADLPEEEWVDDGISFAKEMRPGPETCTEGMSAPLARALVEAYYAIMESKVNQVMTPLYNFLIGTRDWEKVPSGEHEVSIKMRVSRDIVNYLHEHFQRGEVQLWPILGKIAISTTRNSDFRAYKNMLRDIRSAYRLACVAEYELAGHDVSKMEWPAKAQRFMDKFCKGRPAWTPGEGAVETGENTGSAPNSAGDGKIEGGVDTSGWDDWKKYQVHKPVKRQTR